MGAQLFGFFYPTGYLCVHFFQNQHPVPLPGTFICAVGVPECLPILPHPEGKFDKTLMSITIFIQRSL